MNYLNTKVDYHVHTGQWHEIYYEPRDVIRSLKASGTDEIYFSSTTSGRYCKESIAVQGNTDLQKSLPTARELYEFIREEIGTALDEAKKVGLKAHPLYWVIPEVHGVKNQSKAATIKEAMSDLPYEGFKIHPRGNPWNLEDDETWRLTEEVFSYAEEHSLFILIHAGPDDFELPSKFESFIARHPKVLVQLAHCRPLKDTLYMLRTYPNVVCDTAFVDDETKKKIEEAGFADRIRFGTDFPITHYFFVKPKSNPTEENLVNFLKV